MRGSSAPKATRARQGKRRSARTDGRRAADSGGRATAVDLSFIALFSWRSEPEAFVRCQGETRCGKRPGVVVYFPRKPSLKACAVPGEGRTSIMPPIDNDPGKKELKSRIQQLIDSHQVMVFSKSYCPYCVTVRQLRFV